MTETPVGKYQPFPALSEWIAGEALLTDRIEQLVPTVESLEQLPADVCQRAIAVVRDAAAIETGAIEDLYRIDRGITVTAATEGVLLGSALNSQPETVRALIVAQLRAYDLVLDFVTQKQPLAEAWIRELHAQVCAAQSHYKVRTTAGEEDRPLPRGEYKKLPNHVLTGSGRTHYYAAVEETQIEMQRFVEVLRSQEFAALHPVDQAAYTHYALVAVHPFQDGNGRMARALASIFSYRSYRVPLLITVDQKSRYISALEESDSGNYLPFRNFVRERCIDSILLLAQSVRAAQLGTPSESIERVREVFQTRGKYSHVEVDQAGFQLLQRLQREITKRVESPELNVAGLHWSVQLNSSGRDVQDPKYRRPIAASPQLLKVRAQTTSPAEAVFDIDVGVAVPRDAGDMDDFVLECGPDSEVRCLVPVRNVLPEGNLMAEIAIAIFGGEVVAEAGNRVAVMARQSLRNKGY